MLSPHTFCFTWNIFFDDIMIYQKLSFLFSRQLGLYCSTLYSLLVNEVRAFVVVYVVILFTFSGGTYLALRATTVYNAKTGFAPVGVK